MQTNTTTLQQAKYSAQLAVQSLSIKLQQASQLLQASTSVPDATLLCEMIRACTLALAAAQSAM